MEWRVVDWGLSGQRGPSEEGTPGKAAECTENAATWTTRDRAFWAEGEASAKALRWACAWSVRGAVRRLV